MRTGVVRRRLAFLATAVAAVSTSAPAAAQSDTLSVRGTTEPVEIVRDRWGVSHIYARNEDDLFFAQGYNAARDRLFQLEIWRREATGTTAEIFGRRELERDVGARLHRFRGDLRRELNHYHPRGERIVGSFVRGINAYIEQTERDPSLLPVEFELLGIRPGRWTDAVVISRHRGLLGNVGDELRIGRAVAELGPEPVKALSWFHPGEPDLHLDPEIDGALLDADILRLYRAFRTPLRFLPEDVVPGRREDAAALALLDAWLPGELELANAGERIGSNNWVVSGSKMEDGSPVMANDPHRALQAPSLRYIVHLVAPGWNVIGGGEPALPGISIGHNEHGAWGLTVFDVDSEDLYVYDTDPRDPRRYRYGGGWEDVLVIHDTIRVRGEPDAVVELEYTRHGPVLHRDTARNKAFALRAGWLDYGAAPYLASLRMGQARTWEEFREACTYSHIPGENMLWADTAGNIGWQAVGVSPVRPNWSGLVPVPGDGRYEWAGYLPIRDLPHALNPDAGFLVTANNDVVPADYPHMDAIGYSWADAFRANRIDEVLSSGDGFGVPDMMRLQHDELSLPARTLVPMLQQVAGCTVDSCGTRPSARAAHAANLLLEWDRVLDAESVPAAIYVAWERQVHRAVYEIMVPPPAREVIRGVQLTRVLDWLIEPGPRFGDDPGRGRDSVLVTAFEAALGDLEARLGADMSGWRYGQPDYKHVLIRHPMSAAVSDSMRSALEVGPAPRGGYGHTVHVTGSGDNQTHGGTFRIIATTGDWDQSVATNSPGQSGDPASPHYSDLFEPWLLGEYFPLTFSRSAVDSAAESRLVLKPANP